MGSPLRPGRLIQLWPRKHKEEKKISQHKCISYSPLWTHCWCRTWGGCVEWAQPVPNWGATQGVSLAKR